MVFIERDVVKSCVIILVDIIYFMCHYNNGTKKSNKDKKPIIFYRYL